MAEVTLAWFPRVGATLSSFASIALMNIIATKKRRRNIPWRELNPNSRIIFTISFIELIQAICFLLSTSPFPKESGAYGATGVRITCVAQGVLTQICLATPLYSASLSIFYWLTICHNMKSDHFTSNIEPYLHGVSLVLPIASATVCVVLGLIQPRDFICWIGSEYTLYTVIFGMAIVIISWTVVLFCMLSIYLEIRKQTNSLLKNSFTVAMNAPSRTDKKLQREKYETGVQLCMSISVNFLVYVIPFTIFSLKTEGHETPCALIILNSIVFPFRGLLSFFTLTRPMIYLMTRNEETKMSLTSTYRKLIFERTLSSNNKQKKKRRSLIKRKNKSNEVKTRGLILNPSECSEKSPEQEPGTGITVPCTNTDVPRGVWSHIFGSSIGDGEESRNSIAMRSLNSRLSLSTPKERCQPQSMEGIEEKATNETSPANLRFSHDTMVERIPQKRPRRRHSLMSIASVMSEEEFNSPDVDDHLLLCRGLDVRRNHAIQLSEDTKLELLNLDAVMSTCESDNNEDRNVLEALQLCCEEIALHDEQEDYLSNEEMDNIRTRSDENNDLKNLEEFI